MTSLIQIFAKAPLAGRVKTRIAHQLGDACALRLHKILCDNAIRVALAAQADAVEIWTTEAHEFFDRFPVPLCIQRGSELGSRMSFALQHGLDRFDQVMVIGADAYSLTPDYLNQALQSLQQTEVVVGPAEDGGYVLLGATRLWPQLFQDVPWGSADVLEVTLGILMRHRIGFQVLKAQWDIDTVADLEQHAPELLQQLQHSIEF